MAQISSGTAKARGVGSYSKVSTAGPAISAPSEQMAATSSDGAKASPERFGHQQESPDAERAGDDLLGGQHFAEAGAGDGAEGERGFVVEGEGDVRVLHQDVVAQDRGVAQMLQDGDVDLAILLQPGVAGKLKEGEQRERQRRRQRSRAASFRRSLFQLLFDPDAVGIELQRFGEGLAGLGVVILFAQAEAQPELGFGIGGIEFDGLLEIGDGELGAAAQLGRAGSSCRRRAPRTSWKTWAPSRRPC